MFVSCWITYVFISFQILVPRDIKLVVSLPKGLGEKAINTTNLETVSSVINTIAEEIEEHSSRISLKVLIFIPPLPFFHYLVKVLTLKLANYSFNLIWTSLIVRWLYSLMKNERLSYDPFQAVGEWGVMRTQLSSGPALRKYHYYCYLNRIWLTNTSILLDSDIFCSTMEERSEVIRCWKQDLQMDLRWMCNSGKQKRKVKYWNIYKASCLSLLGIIAWNLRSLWIMCDPHSKTD